MLKVDYEKARVLYWSCPKYCVVVQAEHIAMLIGEKGIGRYIHFKREMGIIPTILQIPHGNSQSKRFVMQQTHFLK